MAATECPTCSREFKNEMGVKQHHAKAHGESLTTETVECDACGECEMCGATDDLHLHHIIPLLAGGTNESWNLLTLCQECHTTAEWRTREFTEAVLQE